MDIIKTTPDLKRLIPNTAKMNITKKSRSPIFSKAGMDMINEKRSVRIPFAPLINLRTRPTFATLTTLSKVGETKYFSIRSLRNKLASDINTTTKSNRFHGSRK